MKVKFPESLFVPPVVPQKLLLGPGPSNLPPDVNEAQTLPLQSHTHPEFYKIMADVKKGLQYMFQTTNRLTYAASGAGHAGMESAFMNLVEEGDPVLVLECGIWGIRAAEIAERQRGVVHKLTKPLGQCFTDFEEIEEALKSVKPVILSVCQGESSTGILQPIEGLGPLCHKYNCLLVVDTVASLGANEFLMDQWEVDCVYSGSQKALNCPPGLAPISFSERALEKIKKRKRKPHSFYFDALLMGNYWNCFEEPPTYHHTTPITLMFALRQALVRAGREGLENSIRRHKENALILHKGLTDMGLQLFVKDENLRLPNLTTIKIPEAFLTNWKSVPQHVMKNHQIEVAGGLGPSVGLVWRIGLMGANCCETNITAVLDAMKEALACACAAPLAKAPAITKTQRDEVQNGIVQNGAA